MMFARDCGPGYGAWMGSRWGRRGGPFPPHFARLAEFLNEPAPRAERGEVRYLVLDALASSPRHGYEIMQYIEKRSGGGYRPSPGVIYPTLQLLEELEHARSVERDGRKVYEITDAGQKDLAAHRDSVEEFYDRFGEQPWEAHAEEIAEFSKRIARLVRALRRAARRGRVRPTTMRAVQQVFDEALEKIEQIFSEGDGERER